MKIKNIEFQLELEGHGIVNYDGKEQKWLFTKRENNPDYNQKVKHLSTMKENVAFGKKDFFLDENGNLDYRIKISSNCLRHEIFYKDIPCFSPNVLINDFTRLNYCASPAVLLRGEMLVNEKNTFVRKSPITITHALSTTNELSYTDTCTRNMQKTEKVEIGDKSDTSFYNRETIGDVKYKAEGTIDLSVLQFLSADDVASRRFLNADEYNSFKTILQSRMPNYNSDLKYYQYKTSVVHLPELGALLSNDNIVELVKYFFGSVVNINIKRNNSYARFTGLKIRLIDDNINRNNIEWIEIKSIKDIENLINFDSEIFYTEVDEAEVREYNEKNININAEIKKKVDEKKAADRKKKEEAKKKLKEKTKGNE